MATLFAEEAAQKERARVQNVLPPDLLTGHEVMIRPLHLVDGRTAWLILVTGFANRSEVRAFCEQAATLKLGCMAKGS